MKKIPLTQGKFALVDNEDCALVSQYKWSAHKPRNICYAVHSIKIGDKWTIERMHRLIMGLSYKDNKQIDHVNGNGLDNRKCNLRLCDGTQNHGNVHKQTNNTSGYKGVCWCKRDKKWYTKIMVNKGHIYLGRFNSIVDAAMAYDVAAIKHFGEFAKLNFGNKETNNACNRG